MESDAARTVVQPHLTLVDAHPKSESGPRSWPEDLRPRRRHQTNLFAATVLMGYLTSLLTEGTVLNHVSFFDARQAYVRSTPAIDVLEEVAA